MERLIEGASWAVLAAMPAAGLLILGGAIVWIGDRWLEWQTARHARRTTRAMKGGGWCE